MYSTNLPYYAPPETLPARLPLLDEIEGSKDVLVEQTARKVVGIGSHFIVKYGRQIDLEEGRTMMFIRECAEVPVPRVYALFRDAATKKSYIIMERIMGKTLQEEWSFLSHSQKEAVSAKMKMYIDKMRTVPSPDVFCSVGKQPLRDGIFWTGSNDASLGLEGPFKSELELNDALIQKCLSSDHLKGKAEFYRRRFPDILCGHPPVLTHGDLQRKNVMLRFESNLNLDVIFLDWEVAGWYPSYWEYSRAILGCGYFKDDWHCWVDRILKPYPNEWIWMQTLMLELL